MKKLEKESLLGFMIILIVAAWSAWVWFYFPRPLLLGETLENYCNHPNERGELLCQAYQAGREEREQKYKNYYKCTYTGQ